MRNTRFLNCLSFSGKDKEANQEFNYYRVSFYVETLDDKGRLTDFKAKTISCAKEVYDKVISLGIKLNDKIVASTEVVERNGKQVEKVFDIAKA